MASSSNNNRHMLGNEWIKIFLGLNHENIINKSPTLTLIPTCKVVRCQDDYLFCLRFVTSASTFWTDKSSVVYRLRTLDGKHTFNSYFFLSFYDLLSTDKDKYRQAADRQKYVVFFYKGRKFSGNALIITVSPQIYTLFCRLKEFFQAQACQRHDSIPGNAIGHPSLCHVYTALLVFLLWRSVLASLGFASY